LVGEAGPWSRSAYRPKPGVEPVSAQEDRDIPLGDRAPVIFEAPESGNGVRSEIEHFLVHVSHARSVSESGEAAA
jgi:hypothetical protein